MFIKNLDGAQIGAFIGLARQVIRADGVLAPEEVGLLETIAQTAGFSGEPPAGTVAQLASAFTTRRAKASALLELMGLGFADGEYHPAEKDLIREIAQAFGFSDDELASMEGWVTRQVMLLEEAAGFWEEN